MLQTNLRGGTSSMITIDHQLIYDIFTTKFVNVREFESIEFFRKILHSTFFPLFVNVNKENDTYKRERE